MVRQLANALKCTLVTVSSLGLLSVWSVAADTATKDWSLAGSVDVVNKYASRGVLINDDPVVQPSVTATWKGLSLNVWGNVDTTDFNASISGADINGREWDFSEVDYTLSYTHDVGKFSLTGGYVYYQFPGMDTDATQELFGTVALNDTLPFGLVPSLSAYYDFDEVEGLYLNASLAKSIELCGALTLDLAAGLGWGNAEYNKSCFFDPVCGAALDKDAFLDASISATLNWTVADSFVISPYIKYSQVVDHELASSVDDDPDADAFGGRSTQTTVGLRLSFSF